jgi:hypothetical protein
VEPARDTCLLLVGLLPLPSHVYMDDERTSRRRPKGVTAADEVSLEVSSNGWFDPRFGGGRQTKVLPVCMYKEEGRARPGNARCMAMGSLLILSTWRVFYRSHWCDPIDAYWSD